MFFEPRSLKEFIGQEKIKEDLEILIEHTRYTSQVFGHTIFLGQPGCGKTTLAEVVANELDYKIKKFFAGTFGKTSVEEIVEFISVGRSVIFIDELHAINPKFSEGLLLPMERFIFNGEPIPEFSLIAGTTEFGKVIKPLRDRFVNSYVLRNYNEDDMQKVLTQQQCPVNVAPFIASRSRYTPRLAIKLYNRIKIEWQSLTRTGPRSLNLNVCKRVFERLGIDEWGLNEIDRELIKFLYNYGAFEGARKERPCGVENICVGLDLTRSDYLHLYEPYLVRAGFIRRIPKGREVTKKGLNLVLGIETKSEIVQIQDYNLDDLEV